VTITIIDLGYLDEGPYLESLDYMVEAAQGGVGTQYLGLRANSTGVQFLATIYNTTNLRIMCDFLSRGSPIVTGGNNQWGNPVGTGAN